MGSWKFGMSRLFFAMMVFCYKSCLIKTRARVYQK
jgi:hypothetical protein